MIEARTGNKAICKSCVKPIESGEVRIVETPATDHFPEHHHISCYKEHNGINLARIQLLMEGKFSLEDIVRLEWEALKKGKEAVNGKKV